jgi:predicted ATPase
MAAYQSTGATLYRPQHLSYLASAYAEGSQFDEAWRCISEAMTAVETTKESWYEAEINRAAGEIVLKSPERDAEKAQAYFERALAIARQQQAKSWELRAAMSMALRGEFLIRKTPSDAAAELAFMRAIEVARSQQTRTFALRAAVSLARLWRSQGKPQQARELLAPVYGWFTEGFDTRDLQRDSKTSGIGG